jgi:WD40 repeat protein
MKKNILFVALFALAAMQTSAQNNGNNKILWTQNFEGIVYDCAFMPDENYIIVAHDTMLEVRKTVDQSLVRQLVFKEGIVYTLDVSKDGKYVTVGGGSILKILDLNTFEVIKDLSKTGISHQNVEFSPDGKKLMFSGNDDTINSRFHKVFVIDIQTEKRLFKFGIPDSIIIPPWGEGANISHAKFTPDGKYLVCDYEGGTDPRIFVFDTDSFKLYCTFNNDYQLPKNHGAPGYSFIFSPNSQNLLVLGAAEYSFRVWELETKKEITPNKNVEGGTTLTFLNDNETIYQNLSPLKSWMYNIKKQIKVAEFNFAPQMATAVLNSSETLILGLGLCLMQLDKSVLSV